MVEFPNSESSGPPGRRFTHRSSAGMPNDFQVYHTVPEKTMPEWHMHAKGLKNEASRAAYAILEQFHSVAIYRTNDRPVSRINSN
jgi:hypothetical protein